MKVSYAKVNVDKTISFPLSGKRDSIWVNFFDNHNISQWCDRILTFLYHTWVFL
ncbi:hypothetical protein BJ944DRAFT_267632 [Cunninghamella echinulata]|nr:hypothetical protein BJ944DRAFT_267632 [Cunninghamella echinulata]